MAKRRKSRARKGKRAKKSNLLLIIGLLIILSAAILCVLFLPKLLDHPASGATAENAAKTNDTSAEIPGSRIDGLFIDMADNNTIKRYRSSKEIDANPMERKFMGCFYNATLIRDYSNQKYTLVYSDLKGTPAMNFTFSNMQTAEKTARESGICVYGQNYEFVKRV